MLPVGGLPADAELDDSQQPSYTYNLDLQRGRVHGMTDGLGAIRQFVYKTLQTDRFLHDIYSDDYGAELSVNAGEEDLERWIVEALTQDDRIDDVTDFVFTAQQDSVLIAFTVESNLGQIEVTFDV
ncbi:DUF2634 domain-containing protein [Paenibacillaceae bacterium]|nr:DUF2634 domain-containing protein [Paenibacillaceae bacterium]